MFLPGDGHLWPDDPLDRELVGEWRFDRNTGLILPDYSGYGNHGDNTGADWIATNYGAALRFVTANSDYVDTGVERIGDTGLYAAATEQFTVEVGARINNNETGYLVARKSAGAADGTFGIFFNRPSSAAYTPGVYIRRGGGAGFNTTNWGWDDGTWHWYWVTWDGTTCILYGDNSNSMVLSVGNQAEETGQRIVFGARTNGTGFYLDGDMIGIRIWDRALTAREVQRRYEIRTARASGLMNMWMNPFWGEEVTVGQPMQLRCTQIPHIRQWHPRIP